MLERRARRIKRKQNIEDGSVHGTIMLWQLNFPRFLYFRCDKKGNKRGGGVALVMRENALREAKLRGVSTDTKWLTWISRTMHIES